MRKIIFLSILSLSLSLIFAVDVHAQCAMTQPPGPPDGETINSLDGNISIGVSRKYGGAIAYLKDNRLADSSPANGNIIDYGQGGALFTTAIWTLPPNGTEQQYCYENQKQNGVCPGSLPFNNPTQGGYMANGCAGNPNRDISSVIKFNNQLHISYRGTNFNYGWNNNGFVPPLTETNKSQWQTDFYGDIDISFHPILTDVIIVDTKITYCKQGGCQPIITQDNQLSTLFAAGRQNSNPAFQGPFSRAAYRTNNGNIIENFASKNSAILGIPPYYDQYPNIPQQYKDLGYRIENWAALLWQNQDKGVGVAVDKYLPISPVRPISSDGRPWGYYSNNWPSLSAIEPDLTNFESSGITKASSFTIGSTTYSDIDRFQFQPGGWYKFKTFVATGTLKDNDPQDLRWKLIRAQNSAFSSESSIPIIDQIHGYVDRITCDSPDIAGWVKDERNTNPHLTVQAEIYPEDEIQNKIIRTTGLLTTARPDAGSGAYAFGVTLGALPTSSFGKKIRVNIYAKAADGQNLIYYKVPNLIGPCSNIQSSPTPTPLPLPGDLNHDNKVNISDYNILLQNFGNTTCGNIADIDGNCNVDIFDYNILLGNFGR